MFRWRGLRREGPRAVLAKIARYAPVRVGVGDILDPDRRAPRAGLLTGRRGRAVAAGLAAATAANLPAVMGYKAALRDARPPRRGLRRRRRMLVKVMNYNLLFAPDLFALYPDARLRRPHPRRGGGLRGPRRPRRLGRRRRPKPGPSPRASSSSFEASLAAPGLALRGSRGRDGAGRPARSTASAASTPPPRGASACRTRSASSTPGARSAATARSSSSTASTRWAGTCARTPTRAPGRVWTRPLAGRSSRGRRRCCGISAMRRQCLDRKRAERYRRVMMTI